jgi:AAA family ATP:ADP antiporter
VPAPRAPRWLALPEPHERRALRWSFAYFFCLLCSYYMIRPVRDALGVAGGEERLTWLYMGTLVGTIAATPILGALASRYPRRVFVPVVYHVMAGCLVVFWALLGLLSDAGRLRAAQGFFVWVSIFNLFAVSVFWGFMADLWRSEQGKRLFGLIGMGGTLGAVAGAGATTVLVRAIGPPALLLLAAALLEVAVVCVRRLAPESPSGAPASADEPPGRGAWHGLRAIAASPYLLGICLFLLFYSVTSTLLYFQQARIVRGEILDPAERTAFFARIDLLVNLITVATQALLTGRILSGLGVGPTLAALPVLTVAGFAALAASPTAAVLVWVQVARRAAEFALIRPAREVLFTVVSREEKYVSKSFMDTFVYRSGDASGAWIHRVLSAAGVGVAGIAALSLPLGAAWLALALVLGRRQALLAERLRPSST